MNKFCFVIHPLSLQDIERYEPGAKGKGEPILRKIMEWMPPYAAVHVTGVRTPDGRETEGWFVAANFLPESMLDLPREEVYGKVLGAIEIGAQLGAQVAGLGAFTGVVGDGGVTINERSPIPVTTGNSLTIAAGVQSLFRGAQEMGVDTSCMHGRRDRCDRIDRRRVRAFDRAQSRPFDPRRAQRDAAAQVSRGGRADAAVRERVHDGRLERGAALAARADRDELDARRHRARGPADRRDRLRALAAARREPARRAASGPTCSSSRAATCACRETRASNASANPGPTSI